MSSVMSGAEEGNSTPSSHISPKQNRPTPPIKVLTDTAREILYASVSWFLVFYVVTVAYLLVGAFIFQNLERGEERRQAKTMKALRKNLTLNLFSLAKQHRRGLQERSGHGNSSTINQDPIMYDELFLQEVKQALHRHAQAVLSLSVTTGFDPRFGEERDTVDKWSLAGGLLHASGVISTTGFFNVSPSTLPGRLATVIYAIMGIPLFLMLMSNVGFLLSSSVTLMLRLGLPKLRNHYCIGKLHHQYIRCIRYILHDYSDPAMQPVTVNENPGMLTPHASSQPALAHPSIDQGLSQSEKRVLDASVNKSIYVKRLPSVYVTRSSPNANHVKRLQNAKHLSTTKGQLRSSQDAITNRRFTKHEKQQLGSWHGMEHNNQSMTTIRNYTKPDNQCETSNCHRSENYAQSSASRGHLCRNSRRQSQHTTHYYLKQRVTENNLDDRYPFITYWEPKGSRNIHSHKPFAHVIKERRFTIPVDDNVEAGTCVDTGLRSAEGISETELAGLFLWKKDRTRLDNRGNLGHINSCLVHTPAGLLSHNAEDNTNILHAGCHLPDFVDFLAPADLFVCQRSHDCPMCHPPTAEQLFKQETMFLLQYRFPEMAISVAALIVYILVAAFYFWATSAQVGYSLYQEALYFCVASLATTGANGVDLPMNTSPKKFRTMEILIFQFVGLALLATCFQPGPYPRVVFVGANQHYRLRDLQEEKDTQKRPTVHPTLRVSTSRL